MRANVSEKSDKNEEGEFYNARVLLLGKDNLVKFG